MKTARGSRLWLAAALAVVVALAGETVAVAGVPGLPAGNVHITGRVTNQATGAGISGMCVNVRKDGNGGWWTVKTDAGGRYQVNLVVPPDSTTTYAVWATSGCGDAHWWLTTAYPDPVTVTKNAGPRAVTVSGIDMATTRGGRLAGEITDYNTGKPIQGVTVDTGSGSTTTDANGKFLIGGLPGGSYNVTVWAGNGYLLQLYHHRTWFSGVGDPITVVSGQTTVMNESALPVDRITGTVRDSETGTGLSDVEVTLTAHSGDWSTYPTGSTTDSSGDYGAIVGPGTWTVCFSDNQSPARFSPVCYWNQPFGAQYGQIITVDGYGTTVSGIDQNVG